MIKKHPYLYEIPIFYVALIGANRVFLPEIQGFLGIDPHPYWIGILLFGFRYGIPGGAAAGVVSAVLYLISAWFYAERYLFEDVTFYLLPFFFILGGIFIGLGIQGARRRIVRMSKAAADLLKDAKGMKEEIHTLTEVSRSLEKRIVTRTATLVTLYEGARRLESFRLEDLYPSILDFIAKTLEAEECALYLKDGDRWRLKRSIGWKSYQKRPETFGPTEGITGMAGSQNKILSVRDFIGRGSQEGSPAMLGDCLVAGPLRRGETGEVIGVVGIQSMPFLRFNSATVGLFSFLLQWASRAIGRAAYIHELESKEILDPEYQIYSHSYFLSRSRQELSRSKTYYLPLSFGLVQLRGIEKMPQPQREKFLSAVSCLLKETLREMDVIARYPEESIPFAFLLITTSQTQALGFRDRLLESFVKLGLGQIAGKGGAVELRVGLASFTPRIKELEEMTALARKDLSDAN